VHRGVCLLDKRRVLLQDEMALPKDTDAVWSMHTRAEIELGGRRALLKRDGQRMEVLALLPKGAVFENTSANAKPPENPNEGVRKLLLTAPRPVPEKLVFSVLFTPLEPGQEESEPLQPYPMSRW